MKASIAKNEMELFEEWKLSFERGEKAILRPLHEPTKQSLE
jgi:hypothetical protein